MSCFWSSGICRECLRNGLFKSVILLSVRGGVFGLLVVHRRYLCTANYTMYLVAATQCKLEVFLELQAIWPLRNHQRDVCGQYKGQLRLGNSYVHISSGSQIRYQDKYLVLYHTSSKRRRLYQSIK